MRTNFENAISAMITDSWEMMGDGDVDAPTGYFAIVEIDGAEKALNYCTGNVEWDEAIYSAEKGFYFSREDSDGNIFIEYFSNKDSALARFLQYSDSYSDWMGENE